jgi:23S rRNA (cytosine1962-C5)-methyltransferase
MSKYPSLTLQSGRERSVLNRHPWIFSGAIKKIGGDPKDGDVVSVLDHQNRLLGYGHFCQDASIACRMLSFGSSPLTIDDAFYENRFSNALAYRRQLGMADDLTGGFRLFYSEGDGLPGLVCDLFGDVASLQIKTAGMQVQKSLVVDFLKRELSVQHIFEKAESPGESGGWLLGNKPETTFIEQGLQFCVNVEEGQKTGYFLDQRDNRKLVGRYAKGKRVLDAFSYSGGFSTFALANHAAQVTSLDASEEANELCKQTVALNFGQTDKHQAITVDCFEYLRSLEANQYDLIVLDPPAFSKSAATVDRAARGYKDINLLALKKISPGGLLFTYSCSQHISRDLFRKIIYGAAKDSGRSVRIMHQLSQSPDHPVDVFHPEGEYLKGLVLQLTH